MAKQDAFNPYARLTVDSPTQGGTRRDLRKLSEWIKQMRDLEERKKRGDLLLLAPMVKNRKGFHTEVAEVYYVMNGNGTITRAAPISAPGAGRATPNKAKAEIAINARKSLLI